MNLFFFKISLDLYIVGAIKKNKNYIIFINFVF